MSRGLTSSMRTAVEAPTVYPILFAEFSFASGTVRAWTGVGDLTWGGYTWKGTGDFGGVGSIEETAEVAAKGVPFSLTGIPAEMLALALNDNYQGRAAKLWIGAFDPSGAIVSDPYQLFAGRMDVIEVEDGAETASITLSAETRLIDLNRSRERRYTDEDQRIDYPEDEGFKFVAALQDRPIYWGQKTQGSGGGETDGTGDTSDSP